jgi:hypothetical protein
MAIWLRPPPDFTSTARFRQGRTPIILIVAATDDQDTY